MKKYYVIFFIFIIHSCTNQFSDFISHKNKMRDLYGPCKWDYVGIDTEINNPAIILIPPVGKEYVLFNQKCNLID